MLGTIGPDYKITRMASGWRFRRPGFSFILLDVCVLVEFMFMCSGPESWALRLHATFLFMSCEVRVAELSLCSMSILHDCSTVASLFSFGHMRGLFQEQIPLG